MKIYQLNVQNNASQSRVGIPKKSFDGFTVDKDAEITKGVGKCYI